MEVILNYSRKRKNVLMIVVIYYEGFVQSRKSALIVESLIYVAPFLFEVNPQIYPLDVSVEAPYL